MNKGRRNKNTLARQVTRRLVLTLVLLAVATAILAGFLYQRALSDHSRQSRELLSRTYTAKIAQIEEEWGEEAEHFKSQIETIGLLEDEQNRWPRL